MNKHSVANMALGGSLLMGAYTGLYAYEGYVVDDHISAHNEKVARCANSLGVQATEVAQLNEACQPVFEEFEYGANSEASLPGTYLVPNRTDFIKQARWHEVDNLAERREAQMSAWISASLMLAGLGFAKGLRKTGGNAGLRGGRREAKHIESMSLDEFNSAYQRFSQQNPDSPPQ